MLTEEGIKQIAEADLLRWRAQGSFMNGSGPTTFPLRIAPKDVETLRALMEKAQNFVYWMTPDFRVCFTTKDGLIDSGGKRWKVRLEWRGVGKNGKAGVSGAQFERKVTPDEALPALEGAISQLAAQFVQASRRVDDVSGASGNDRPPS